MGGNVIVTKDIHKVYKLGDTEVHALRGVSIDIKEGEFVSIMGASGSGKSTFMNIIGCLDKPTSGNYFLDGSKVSEMEKDALADIRNRKIGFVFQSFNLLARTTAAENVELPMIYNNTPSRTRAERAYGALSRVGLSGREKHYPSQLSGGQQQRVAIARAIVNDPSIILADEPTGNLDTATSSEIMEIFKSLNEQGKTIIIITHEHDIAENAERIVVFKDGSITEEKSKNGRGVRAAQTVPT
ncbi:MAG: macrolide ABC transporter ATP-binding protein [Candidatus Dadabacteria bacterium RIFCSPHIGHO2_12_FULL_53_21]|nr:MAG: macrolide ABC transporter ATP-binding protein [Candidatus Dadabacteria bacterium RIFCSPHIGHO2_12_FULL_53_21]